MALGGEDGSVTIISPEDWSVVKELKVASSVITALKFSRRNERLAVGTSDGIVTLLIPETGWKIAGEIETSDIGISSIDWSSRHLAVGRFDGTISIHETSRVYANFFLPEAELTRGDGPVHSVAFGLGGQFLGTCRMSLLLSVVYEMRTHSVLHNAAVGDANGKVGIYSAKGGWVLCHQLNTPGAVLATKWSSSGEYLAFGGEQREMVRKIHVGSVSLLLPHDVGPTFSCLSPFRAQELLTLPRGPT
jgi:WD40 repeat protein